MATLAEIRAKLKSQEVNRSTSATGGDNAIYPHWNIQEGQESVVRFLPDKDTANTFFWTEYKSFSIYMRLKNSTFFSINFI